MSVDRARLVGDPSFLDTARQHVCMRNIGATLCASACMSLATAQDLVPEKSVSVRDRPRPEYAALGIRWGAFRLHPRLTVGASHNDNIYASDADIIDDRITTLAGNVSLRSQGERVPMAVYGQVASQSYSDNPLEDHVDWEGGGAVGYTFARRTAVRLSRDYALDHQARGEPSFPSAAIELPSFETDSTVIEITREFSSGQLNLTADYESIDFDDAKLAEGATLDQDSRDRDTRTIEVRGTIIVGQSTAVFVRAVHEDRDYRLDSVGVNRDAATDALYGGATFDISNLARGEVGIGVFELDNHDPGQSDSRSVAVSSNVELYMTQLMTATLDVQRTSAAADIAGSSSYIETSISLGVDYEMRRNLILSARVARSRRNYTGIDPAETIELAGVRAQWLLNRRLNLGFDYTLTERMWPFPEVGQNYAERMVTTVLSLAL